jgi:hypothetical protein
VRGGLGGITPNQTQCHAIRIEVKILLTVKRQKIVTNSLLNRPKELKPHEPENYGLHQVILNMAESEKNEFIW